MLHQLHYNAVPEETLGLLRALQALESLHSAYLAGGTALALYVGHRLSEDIDIFLPQNFDVEALEQDIRAIAELTDIGRAKNTLSARVGGVKTDIITFAYPILEPIQEIEGIRLASLPDIAGMKLSAVVNRGAKKDFWDVHRLLTLISLPEMLDCFQAKFRQHETLHVLRALTYFDDAEISPDPITILPVSWAEVKIDITKAVKLYARM